MDKPASVLLQALIAISWIVFIIIILLCEDNDIYISFKNFQTKQYRCNNFISNEKYGIMLEHPYKIIDRKDLLSDDDCHKIIDKAIRRRWYTHYAAAYSNGSRNPPKFTYVWNREHSNIRKSNDTLWRMHMRISSKLKIPMELLLESEPIRIYRFEPYQEMEFHYESDFNYLYNQKCCTLENSKKCSKCRMYTLLVDVTDYLIASYSLYSGNLSVLFSSDSTSIVGIWIGNFIYSSEVQLFELTIQAINKNLEFFGYGRDIYGEFNIIGVLKDHIIKFNKFYNDTRITLTYIGEEISVNAYEGEWFTVDSTMTVIKGHFSMVKQNSNLYFSSKRKSNGGSLISVKLGRKSIMLQNRYIVNKFGEMHFRTHFNSEFGIINGNSTSWLLVLTINAILYKNKVHGWKNFKLINGFNDKRLMKQIGSYKIFFNKEIIMYTDKKKQQFIMSGKFQKMLLSVTKGLTQFLDQEGIKEVFRIINRSKSIHEL